MPSWGWPVIILGGIAAAVVVGVKVLSAKPAATPTGGAGLASGRSGVGGDARGSSGFWSDAGRFASGLFNGDGGGTIAGGTGGGGGQYSGGGSGGIGGGSSQYGGG